MTLPNFLVIGAGKSGTTSLYHYLRQHPDVFMSPVKEPNFFAAEGGKISYTGPNGETMSRPANPGAVTDMEDYRALFAGVSGEKAVGEATPQYLYAPEAPARIKRYVPDAKLVAVLRNPVERAYSAFLHRTRLGREPLTDFSEALREEEKRMREGWGLSFHYKNKGFYYAQLSRYIDLFGPERIRVYLYEDLKADPAGVSQDIFRFLEVDDAFVPDASVSYNTAGVPKSGIVSALVKRAGPAIFLRKRLPLRIRRRLPQMGVGGRLKGLAFAQPPPLPAEAREELIREYREDVLKLQVLIGRDLSGWLR
jgi:hypothetical protein